MIEIGLRRPLHRRAIVEKPQSRGVPIDAVFAFGGLICRGAGKENIEQQRVQNLMRAGVDREEWYAVAMRVA